MNYLSEANREHLRGVALLRLDFNSTDSWRMEAALPTIKLLKKEAHAVVILSHRGRPKGHEEKFTLAPEARRLGRLLGERVSFLPCFDFGDVTEKINHSEEGSVFVLENLRYEKGEEENDPKFAKALASLGDYYVNDAFAVSHRAHASVEAITRYLPSYAGLCFEREISMLRSAMEEPKKPLVVVLGGGKAADKLGLLNYFRNKTDSFLLGGSPANTLSYLTGVKVGQSLRDREKKHLSALKKILSYKNLVLPVDFNKKGNVILDIGERTSEIYAERIGSAKTLIWNGPVGYFEDPKFAKGSLAIARAIEANKDLFSIVGGGETVAFLRKYKMSEIPSFVSTGGGAMLEFLAGKNLPGIRSLEKNALKYGKRE